MPDIYIRRNHKLGLEEAHELIDEVAGDLAESIGAKIRKDGDTLVFTRPGANGRIRLSGSEIIIEASLGIMLKALRPVIETAINNKLDEYM